MICGRVNFITLTDLLKIKKEHHSEKDKMTIVHAGCEICFIGNVLNSALKSFECKTKTIK